MDGLHSHAIEEQSASTGDQDPERAKGDRRKHGGFTALAGLAQDLQAKVAKALHLQHSTKSTDEQTSDDSYGVSFRSVREAGRAFVIVTTASLPWMTGTAVNPLLRAAYLTGRPGPEERRVSLLVPWLPLGDQQAVFPGGRSFSSVEEQRAYVLDWVSHRVGFTPNFQLLFYPARYYKEMGSIFAVGDITEYVSEAEADVALLEEPEHLTWFHHGCRWTSKFHHVVGIMHTNYLEYARREAHGEMNELVLKELNKLMCHLHCHKVIKLSGAVQDLPRQVTMFVHGVSPTFLAVGDSIHGRQEALADTGEASPAGGAGKFRKGAYYIGKVLWAKGYTELLDKVGWYKISSLSWDPLSQDEIAPLTNLDVYGGGEDLESVKTCAAERRLPLSFHGPIDHAHPSMHEYKLFVNPSLSDVVATTTAEALAMGKFVVVAEHPSNEFFSTFGNCRVYRTPEEFVQCMAEALKSEPAPLTAEERHRLTWEAATERLLDVADVEPAKHCGLGEAMDKLTYGTWNALTGLGPIRSRVFGDTHARSAVHMSDEDMAHWACSVENVREGADLPHDISSLEPDGQA